MLISVEDLRVGDRIKEGSAKPFTVQKKKLCSDQWRSHIHVNDTKCYWSKAKVWIV